ncbi:hypothetical protein ACFLX2_00165 [Candidatus Dependentiae bacterium]
MKKICLSFGLLLSVLAKADQFLIDRIEAVVFGHEGTAIVTKSEVDRMTLDGQYRTVDDVIFEKLVFEEAKKFRITVDENDINRYLANVQRENNLSLDDLKAMFSSAGYTYQEGRAQLGVMFAVNSVMDFKIRSRLIVLESDVQDYYNAHPMYEEAALQLQRAVIPFDTAVTHTQQKAKIENQMKAGRVVGVNWSTTFWINKDDLAAEKKFIVSMKPGQVSRPKEIAEGFEIFKLVAFRPRRLVLLEDRYREIADVLRRPRYDQLFADFKKELFEASSIVRF